MTSTPENNFKKRDATVKKSRVYLDYNASTPLKKEALEAMVKAANSFGNPSSIHTHGREARNLMETARDALAETVSCDPLEVTFTSGGTETNNWFLKGVLSAGSTVFVSAIEHESLEKHFAGSHSLSILPSGLLDLENLEQALSAFRMQHPDPTSNPVWVTVMLANSETGALQPLPEIVQIARRHNAFVHTDAIQALGKVPVSFTELGVDAMTLSAHKIGGPKGVGAMIARHDAVWAPLITGTGQERGARSGTENVIGIAGFGAALKAINLADYKRIENLRDSLELNLKSACPALRIYGENAPRLPNTSYIGMPGVPHEKQQIFFDLEGFSVSGGAACSSGRVKKSHVLQAMGIVGEAAGEAIRISLGWLNTEEEIQRFADSWTTFYERNKKDF